jgi:malonyl-CoA/methylmalonyl-CoA synthetase
MSELTRRLQQLLSPASEPLGAPLLVDDDGPHGAEALGGATRALASRLAASTAEGDRVLVDLPRGASWLVAFAACLLARRVAVPLPEGAPAAEMAAMKERSGARAVLVAPLTGRPASEALDALLVIEVEAPGHGGEDALPSAALPTPAGDDAAVFLFTSGTTGRPKAAIITHDNLAAQAAALRDAWALGPGDVLLHALPLHHTHGIVVALLSTLLAGGRVRMLRRFEARRVWDAMSEATVWMAVPTMTSRLFEVYDAATDEERARWASGARALRLATSGSAALPVGLAARWRDVTGCIPLERYGMTEIGMALSNPLAPERRRAGTVGTPLPGVEVRVAHADGADAGEGPGELWVSGPAVFAGYFGDLAATQTAFAPDDGGSAVYFRTGDVVVIEDGAYRLLGRASVDILKTGGEKVSALEIEELLREHPAIAEVAVVGVPDATWGDRVVAAVVPVAGAVDCTPDTIRTWAKTRLAPFKVPRQVVVVDALPRNAMGKVMKPAIVAKITAGE